MRKLAVCLVLALVAPVSAGLVATGDLGAEVGAGPGGEPALPRYLSDVEGQFDALSLRPDGLAFGIGDSPDPRVCKHYQGMARVDGPDGTPYLLVSRSGNQPGGLGALSCPFEDDDPGNLLVVELGSRDTDGERLRSNRLTRGWPIDGIYTNSGGVLTEIISPTPPDPADRVVRTISFDGGDWPNYAHPGGMQVIGDVLVLAQETPYDPGLADNLFMFIDVSDPQNPSRLSEWEPPDPGSDFSAGLVGITPLMLESGALRYVIVATGKENKEVRFYRSLPTAPDGSTDLRSHDLEWEEVGRYTESQIEGCIDADWHTGGGDAHQNLNFVRQGGADGPLYLIGGRNTTPLPSGDDKMDLYRVDLDGDGTPAECVLERERTIHVTSKPYIGGGDSANFAAASGVYVSPSGELIVYAAEFENDGPRELLADGSRGRQTVRFAEYRHEDVVRPDSPLRRPSVDAGSLWEVDEGSSVALAGTGTAPAARPFLQWYEDDGAGNDSGGFLDSNAWVNVDYADRDADDFDRLGGLTASGRLDNQAGSWRWFAPAGCTINANDLPVGHPNWPGPDTVTLPGIGSVQVETDLDRIDFDDDLGGVTFGADCADYYSATMGVEWDLDGNGSFETSGTAATFDAATLDGPTTRSAGVRAVHPTDPTALRTSPPVGLSVVVRNVAPTITTAELSDGRGNSIPGEVPVVLPQTTVTLDASFTDPGVDDTQSAAIDWGDGTVDASFDQFSDASGGAVGRVRHSHAFAAPGTYTVEVSVTDDDGGEQSTQLELTVVDAAGALEAAAGMLVDAAASAADPLVRDLLDQAIDDIRGNNGGEADNGALDSLEADDPISAITHVIAVHEAIEAATAAGAAGLDPIQDLLTMAVIYLGGEYEQDAAAAVDPPSRGEAKQLATIADFLDAARAELASDHHREACVLVRRSVNKALRLA